MTSVKIGNFDGLDMWQDEVASVKNILQGTVGLPEKRGRQKKNWRITSKSGKGHA